MVDWPFGWHQMPIFWLEPISIAAPMLRYADLFPIEFAGGSRSFWDQEMDGLAIPSPYERNLPQFLGPQFMNRSSTFSLTSGEWPSPLSGGST